MTQFNKKAKWLVPFYESVRDLLPYRGRKLDSVKMMRPKTGYTEIFGRCYEEMDGQFTILIHSHARRIKSLNGKFQHVRFDTFELLSTFAHELAHMEKGFDHTPAHDKLTARINAIFMKELIRQGFISIEKSGEFFSQS